MIGQISLESIIIIILMLPNSKGTKTNHVITGEILRKDIIWHFFGTELSHSAL